MRLLASSRTSLGLGRPRRHSQQTLCQATGQFPGQEVAPCCSHLLPVLSLPGLPQYLFQR